MRHFDVDIGRMMKPSLAKRSALRHRFERSRSCVTLMAAAGHIPVATSERSCGSATTHVSKEGSVVHADNHQRPHGGLGWSTPAATLTELAWDDLPTSHTWPSSYQAGGGTGRQWRSLQPACVYHAPTDKGPEKRAEQIR
jgi:hypothetical protein